MHCLFFVFNYLIAGSRSRSGGTKIEGTNAASLMEEREDVVFISSKDSEASALWVNYLTACFEQISRQQGRPPFKLVSFHKSTIIPFNFLL